MNIIFDLDGTLIDSSERMYQLFQDLIPESDFTKQEYWNYKRELINHKMLLNRFFPQYDYEEFNTIWLDKIELDEYLDMDNNYEDTVEALSKLSQKHTIILLTARQSKARLYRELSRLKIYDFFNEILVTEAQQRKKELLQDAVDSGRIKICPNDFFVGDTVADIICGNELGLRTVAVTHGFSNRSNLERCKPDRIIDELSEIVLE